MQMYRCTEWDRERAAGKKGAGKEQRKERLLALQLEQHRSRINVVLHVGQREFSLERKTHCISKECKQDSWSLDRE